MRTSARSTRRVVLATCGVAVLLAGCAGAGTETTPAADEATEADDGSGGEGTASEDSTEAAADGAGGGFTVRAGLGACDVLTADTLGQLFELPFQEGQGNGPNICNFQAADGGDHGALVTFQAGSAFTDQARRRFEAGVTIEREVGLGDLSYVEAVTEGSRIAVLVVGDTVVEVALNNMPEVDPAAVDELLQSVLDAITE